MPHPQPSGFLALPNTASRGSVLVLHPWWGLNDTIKAFCTRLAGEGFTVFAPDLYHGKLATIIEQAEALSSALDGERAKAEVAEAAAFLRERAIEDDRGLAVVGFSLGAFFALDLSTTDPENIRAVVLFYGTGPGDCAQSKAAYLGHFAGNDPYEPDENVHGLENELRQAGRPVTFHRYPDTGHWFFEPDRTDAYNPEAAALAWERTLEFLNENSPKKQASAA